MSLESYLAEHRARVTAELDRRLPAPEQEPRKLHEAIRYAVFSGGKRFRPILCLAAAESVGRETGATMTAAVAIELVHTYTLVHDDLPCMDDDALRRGKPTVHKAFDEATAVLAGDALLTLAFELLATAPVPGLCAELARAAGTFGVIGGQAADLEAEHTEPTAAAVDRIHSLKTGALIRCALRMGAMTAGATGSQLEQLSEYGDCLGLAFQIEDDILNATSTAEHLGKPVGSDRDRGKATYVAVHGLDAARSRAAELVGAAVRIAEEFGDSPNRLAELARFVLDRTA